MNVAPQELDEIVAGGRPVLVDFWAEWCAPCKVIAPFVDEIADEHADKLRVVKLDVGTYPDAVEQYRVNGVPHMILFDEGEVLARLVGARSKEALLDTVLPLLEAE